MKCSAGMYDEGWWHTQWLAAQKSYILVDCLGCYQVWYIKHRFICFIFQVLTCISTTSPRITYPLYDVIMGIFSGHKTMAINVTYCDMQSAAFLPGRCWCYGANECTYANILKHGNSYLVGNRILLWAMFCITKLCPVA